MTKTCTILVKDEVWCSVTGLTSSEHEQLWRDFAPFKDGYFFMPSYKLGRWDGRIRFYEKTGKTYVRLLDRILPYIEKWGYHIELVDHRPALCPPSAQVDENLFAHREVGGRAFSMRPYQVECVREALAAGSGVILAGTGAGKTTITAALSHVYSTAGYKTITIVPSSDLVTQTAEWYEQLGMPTGIYSGSEKNIDSPNVVATWQSLQYNPSILSEFRALIWDETHGASAAVAKKLLNEDGSHIPFRFGVTGTFPKPEVDQMSIFSSIGPILKEIPARWLIDAGYLSKVEIQPVVINETYIEESFPDYASERAFLSKNSHRMEKIADLIISQCATHGNTLVLVNSIPFGQKLSSLIKDSIFLYGDSPKDIRKEHYDMFDQKDDIIVIASAGIASTGISIDRIFCLMLIDPAKSFIKAIQSVGRGLRRGRDKDSIVVFDVHSKLNWAKKHFKERNKYYKDAQYPVLAPRTLRVTREN